MQTWPPISIRSDGTAYHHLSRFQLLQAGSRNESHINIATEGEKKKCLRIPVAYSIITA